MRELELRWTLRRYRMPATGRHFVLVEARHAGLTGLVRAWSLDEITWMIASDEPRPLPFGAGMAAHIGDAVRLAESAFLDQLSLHERFGIRAARRKEARYAAARC